MKIDFTENNLVDFNTLKPGDVFSYEGSYVMRMESVAGDCGDVCNAVDLTYGETLYISDRAKVRPIKCKLVVDKEG